MVRHEAVLTVSRVRTLLRSGWPLSWLRNRAVQAGGVLLLVIFVLLLVEALHRWVARETALASAERDMVNLARSLNQHADSTFEIADSVLIGVTQRLEAHGFGAENLADVRRTLLAQVPKLSRLRHVFVYDADGNWLISSLANQPKGMNNSDRAYFQHHRNSPDMTPFIGLPVRSRSEGHWIITITRRLTHPDGRFAGVVLASVDVSYFEEHYAQFDIGSEGSIGLVSAAGVLMARSPSDSAAIGRNISNSRLFQHLAPQLSAGTYRYTSPIDGIERISGYYKSSRFPVMVIAALGRSDALAGSRPPELLRASLMTAVTGAVGVLGLLLVRQVARRQRAEIALTGSEKAFRMLTENSSDMVSRIGKDGTRHYVSPASFRLLGWMPSELVGRSALEGIPPDHRETVQQAMARLQGGEAEEVTVAFPTMRRDETQIWVESSLRLIQDSATGKVDSVVAVTRDISERKRQETALSSMAMTDALTGLANRRGFDEALVMEWRRAARNRLGFSVLLIDLDRFKQFNDTYGHPAGDECLKRAAQAIQTTIGRPADIAARYGGEELAVILPGTATTGASVLAERIRQAIAACGIPHAANSPAGIVTASIGLATVVWTRDGSPEVGPPDIITAADQALYTAKNDGRNRVVSAPPICALALGEDGEVSDPAREYGRRATRPATLERS